MDKNLVAVLCATESEIRGFLGRLNIVERGRVDGLSYFDGEFPAALGDIRVLVVITGVGIRKARKAANAVINRVSPSYLISAGFCGALDPSLRVGDAVLGEGVFSRVKGENITLFSDLDPGGLEVVKGGLLTENRFISSAAEKSALYRETRALCVDMETWGAAEAASQKGVTLVALRVVSDTYREVLPEMGRIMRPKGGVDLAKALKYFFYNPSKFVPFFAFRFIKSKKAAVKLEKSIAEVLNEMYGESRALDAV